MIKKFFYVYKITNLVNNMIYIGIRSTNNVENDNYMSSSKHLKKDIKNLGKENFKKEILFVFDNKDEVKKKEAELVNKDFVMRADTYNRMEGGLTGFSLFGMPTVIDAQGNCMRVYKDDPRYLSGELVANSKGRVVVKDKNNNSFVVEVTDERYLNGELVPVLKGIKTERATFKDKKHTSNTKEKMRKVREERKLGFGVSNSQFGSYWITNGVESKKIKDKNIPKGWYKGRKIKMLP